ncbi:MAG TPA: long-chain fatty acid--CoA ligase [Devosiaceae bacterium]|nr:long-chain fatty acid--CoA ligase [Devosiaceae bacterium]
MTVTAGEEHPRPWIDHYPADIRWDAPIDTTPVFEQVLAACERTPNVNALDFLGKRTRFSELAAAINAFAGALQAQFGIRKGSRVALLLPNTPFYVIAYYGVLRAGGTVVNCNPLYTIHELTHITSNAGAELMVTLDLKQLFDKAEALVEAGHVKSLIVCHFPDALPPIKSLLYRLAKRKDLAPIAESRIAAKITRFGEMLARNEPPAPISIDRDQDIAVQQYTGGTTGLPKGAMLSHANIAANRSQIEHWSLGLFQPPSRIVAVLPFFHIFAMTACMNLPLCNGAQVVMLPRFEMRALLDLLVRTGANVLLAVPTLIQALAKGGEKAAPKLASLEVVVSGGAALPSETRASWAKVSPALLAEGYGLTEASPVVCCAALRVPGKPMSIGQPLPGTDIRFIDIDTQEPVPLGERGELQVKGPQVMVGYYDNPEATREAFADGWLRTGDVGYMDSEGYVYLVDRIKDLIITSGFNVYPRTIEEALSEHPAVDECTVIGVPDDRRGEAPVAFVKLVDGARTTEAELRKFLTDKLNRLELPREIHFRGSLPKTLIGKLSKKELREEYRKIEADKSEQG